jgi:hypothetical protein
MAGEKFQGLTNQQIIGYVTGSHQITPTDTFTQPIVEFFKSFRNSLFGHFILIGVSGGVLTVFILRTINPLMPWGRAIGYGVVVIFGVVALLTGAHYLGWMN